MGLFKKNETQKNVEELGLVQGTIREVTAHLNDLKTIKAGLELELKLGADSALEKRFKKLTDATEKAEKQLSELQAREAELNKAINEGNAQKRKEEVETAAKAYEERQYKALKQTLFRAKAERIVDNLRSASTVNEPTELKRIEGIKYNDKASLSKHSDLAEAKREAENNAHKRAKAEFDALLEQIEAFLDRK